jgi:antagonist of KipI
MSLRVVRPGFLSTVQDAGRWGYQSQGVPVGGAMDGGSLRLANLLVGNAETGAVIEMTLHGAELAAERDLLIAVTGGGARVYADEAEIQFNRAIGIRQGTVLKFLPAGHGRFTYLAVAGGVDVAPVMNSRSTYLPSGFGGLGGRALQRGDLVAVADKWPTAAGKIWKTLRWDKGQVGMCPWTVPALHAIRSRKVVRILEGPEWHWFTEASHSRIFSTVFLPTPDSNRMGYRLEGIAMERAHQGELISTAVSAGTMQCLPNGMLVVLMADSQTTGGYPRIAQVAAADLSICAQARTHEPVFFQPVSLPEAEQLFLERERWFQSLQQGLDTHLAGL